MSIDAQLAAIQEKIARIKESRRNRGLDTPDFLRLNPPVPLELLHSFEARNNIHLPLGYRRFLLEIGNGGGIFYPLEKSIAAAQEEGGILSEPFPYTGDPNIDGLLFDQLYKHDPEAPDNGILTIAYHGCTHWDVLVVSGPQAGTVWYDGRGIIDPINWTGG